MKSTKNMLLNEAVLGYVPSAVDSNRVVDYEYNVQVHLPHKYTKEAAEKCVNSLRRLLLSSFREFDYKSVKVIKHKPYDNAYFHHVSTQEVNNLGTITLACYIWNRHLAGCIRTKTFHGGCDNHVVPTDVFLTNKSSKSIKD